LGLASTRRGANSSSRVGVHVHLFVDEALDVGQQVALIGGDKGDGDTIGAHAARAADAVDVILRVHRQIVIDDMRDVGHVDARPTTSVATR